MPIVAPQENLTVAFGLGAALLGGECRVSASDQPHALGPDEVPHRLRNLAPLDSGRASRARGLTRGLNKNR